MKRYALLLAPTVVVATITCNYATPSPTELPSLSPVPPTATPPPTSTATPMPPPPGYVILTDIPPDDPFWAAVQRLREYRAADIVSFDSDVSEAADTLHALSAQFVAVWRTGRTSYNRRPMRH